jgi:predicted dehydrogenase
MTASVKQLGWGILSTANIGRAAVIPAIGKSSNGEVRAVASRDAERAREFAAANGIPSAHGTYEAMLDDDGIDAVYIPLPNSLHREWTVRFAEAGKHVLCEKPLAVTAAECEEMAKAADAAGVVCMEAFMYRFHPRIDAVLALIGGGGIGELRSLYSAFTFKLTKPDNIRWAPELGGGALMDVGCYCVNVTRTMTGSEPFEAQAVATWTDRGVDAQLAGTLRFDGGVTAQIDCSLSMERREVFHVAGTDGHLEIANAFLPGTGDVTIEEHHGRGEPVRHAMAGADEYQLMVEHFGECVVRGAPVRYPLREAAANMRTIEALYRSARNGGGPERVRR